LRSGYLRRLRRGIAQDGGRGVFFRIFDPSKLAAVEEARQARETRNEEKVLPLPAEFWSIFPLAITYALARGYLIAEAFMGLRQLHQSAYATVNWTAFIPHI